MVVIASCRPDTASAIISRGELPKSKPTLPEISAVIRRPPRSPANSKFGFAARAATASSIVPHGRMPVAPLARATVIVEVARNTSNTTQHVALKSRPGSDSNSTGDNKTSSFGKLIFGYFNFK